MNAQAARRLAEQQVASNWKHAGWDINESPESFDEFQESVDDMLGDWAFEDARERAEHGDDECLQIESFHGPLHA